MPITKSKMQNGNEKLLSYKLSRLARDKYVLSSFLFLLNTVFCFMAVSVGTPHRTAQYRCFRMALADDGRRTSDV